MANSRGPASLASFVSSAGPSVRATSPADAVAFGEVILLAIPWRNKDQLPPGNLFVGKIAIDAMNPYSAVGHVIDLGERTSSEEVAKQLPGARLVKAFNTMGWKTLETGGQTADQERLTIFLAGDDVTAKTTVATLIEGIGFAPLDTGSLREGGRRQQPGSPFYGRPMTLREAKRILG